MYMSVCIQHLEEQAAHALHIHPPGHGHHGHGHGDAAGHPGQQHLMVEGMPGDGRVRTTSVIEPANDIDITSSHELTANETDIKLGIIILVVCCCDAAYSDPHPILFICYILLLSFTPIIHVIVLGNYSM